MFDYAHLEEKYIDALKTRVFNKSYETAEVKDKTPNKNYTPEVIYKDKNKKKKNKRKI